MAEASGDITRSLRSKYTFRRSYTEHGFGAIVQMNPGVREYVCFTCRSQCCIKELRAGPRPDGAAKRLGPDEEGNPGARRDCAGGRRPMHAVPPFPGPAPAHHPI